MRYILAAVLLWAAVDKLLHFDGFVAAAGSYVLVPDGLALYLAPLVIMLEVLIGAALLSRRERRPAALAAAAFLSAVTIAYVGNQILDPGAVCGCWFTLTVASGTWSHIGLNCALIAMAILVCLDTRSARPPTTLSQGKNVPAAESTT